VTSAGRQKRTISLFGSLLLAALAASPAAEAQRPPRAEAVYLYEISADTETIRIDFDIADGGYLYRSEFSFGSGDPRVRLGAPRLPDGEIHTDEFLEGEQEIYRHAFSISIPYTRTAAVESAEILLGLRGCNENFGICYPPQQWTATVELPEGPIAAAGSLAGSLFAGAESDEPLPVEQAFIGNARFDSANELTVSWQIAPGYYLYRDQFKFAVDGGVELGAARLPEGVAHDDLTFGEVEVYYDFVETVVPFARANPDEQPLSITAGFRGCKDDSICYPPSEQIFALTLPAAGEFPAAGPPAKVSEQDRFAALITGDSWLAFLGAFYVAGLLLSFTPCVLPMVPILSSIIAGQGQASAQRGFALSLSYVLGMAFTYSIAGVLAALAGSQIQAMFQKPWIIATFAGLFVVMALGMFGLFEIQMPTALQSRIAGLTNRQKGGTFLGTAIIGALTALIVTTCVAPPLIGALAVIGQSGDVVRGATALFALSIGMGTPLLLVGASAGKLLPKVGPWMNTIKAGFGVVMIGMAIWMLDRVLPATVTLLLWALLVFMTGVFLGAFESLGEQPRPVRRLAKGLGVLACLYGALMLIGWVLGGDDPLEPIPRGGFLGQVDDEREELDFVAVDSVAQLETLLGQASVAGQPVMVDFTADWCVACKEMEEYTFPEQTVVSALEPFLLLRADVTANDDDDQALLEYFETVGPPTIVFYDRSGRSLESFGYTLVGFTEADEFAAHVAEVSAL
jgi:thiol:disulfide interchange protein DsbD